MEILVLDVETDGLLPDLTTCWCLAISGAGKDDVTTLYADQPGYPPIAEGLARMDAADRWVFHNGIGFDLWALRKLYGNQYLKRNKLWDTLTVSRLLYADKGRHALGAWGEHLGYAKGDHSDWSQFSKEMADYCIQDVEVTKRIYWTLQGKLKADYKAGTDWREAIRLEHDFAWVIAIQEQHGFRLDMDACYDLAAELSDEKAALEAELVADFPPRMVPKDATWDHKTRTWQVNQYTKPKKAMRRWVECEAGVEQRKGVAGYYEQLQAHDPEARTGAYSKVGIQSFNPGSRQHCVFRLTDRYRWKPTKFSETGQPAVDAAVLADLPYPEAVKLKRCFDLGKSLGQISDGKSAWLKLERNGRIHGAVNTNGAVTGRCTHFAPNVSQVSKKEPRMRACWVADEGHSMVGCDASGLELRCLGHFLAATDGGEYARGVVEGKSSEGTDVHTRTQNIVGLYSRDYAKTITYALLYGAGDTKLGATVHADLTAAGVKPDDAKTPAGKQARANLESGFEGLGKLSRQVKSRAKSPGYIKGLDGRRVAIRSEHAALNTLLQSAGALVMKKATVIFHYQFCVEAGLVDPDTAEPVGWNYTHHVHDEAGFSAPADIAEQLGRMYAEAITAAGEAFSFRCPLAGEYMIGDSWATTH